MDLLTPLETYCRLIIRAREMEAQVPAQDGDDDPSNVDDLGDGDEESQSLSVLEDELNSVEEEIVALLEDLADDQIAEAVALAWVGVGTYDSSEWDEACAEAEELDPEERVEELMNMPTLAANIESGLAAFEFNCDDIGQMD